MFGQLVTIKLKVDSTEGFYIAHCCSRAFTKTIWTTNEEAS